MILCEKENYYGDGVEEPCGLNETCRDERCNHLRGTWDKVSIGALDWSAVIAPGPMGAESGPWLCEFCSSQRMRNECHEKVERRLWRGTSQILWSAVLLEGSEVRISLGSVRLADGGHPGCQAWCFLKTWCGCVPRGCLLVFNGSCG